MGQASSLPAGKMPASLSSLNILAGVAALALIGYGLRIFHLGAADMDFDESWSMGLASLRLSGLLQLTARDTHPPLYALLLQGWNAAAGKSAFSMRYLALSFSLLLVPISYHLGRSLFKSRAVGWVSCSLAVVSPFYIFHARDGRSFAAVAFFGGLTLLLFWKRKWRLYAVAAGLSIYTLYYAAFALVAQGLYVALRRRADLRRWVGAMAAVALAYAPWTAYELPAMLTRLQAQSRAGSGFPTPWAYLSAIPLSLTFTWETRVLWITVVFGLLALVGLSRPLAPKHSLREGATIFVGDGEGWRGTSPRATWFLPKGQRAWSPVALLSLVLIVHSAGVYAGTFAQPFYPRYFLPVEAAFLALVAAGIVRLGRLGTAAGLLAAGGSVWLVATSVYPVAGEDSGYWRPSAVYTYLHEHARPDDGLLFNIMELAGYYESHRQAGDPAQWRYVVSEKPVYSRYLQSDLARVTPELLQAPRTWLLLYGGRDYGANRAIAAVLNRDSFFVGQDQLKNNAVLLYVNPARLSDLPAGVSFGGQIALDRIRAGIENGVLLLDLRWRALRAPDAKFKVFVHLLSGGKVIAQQDVEPQAGDAPTDTWQPGQVIEDHHAVVLPAARQYEIELGLYAGDRRLKLEDGRDSWVLQRPAG